MLGVRSVRLITNNPAKAEGLTRSGLVVEERVPLPTSAHARSMGYLRTKERRLAHLAPAGDPLPDGIQPVTDVTPLLGEVRTPFDRPYVVLKYAQTLDGRIATRTGDARWISGEPERRMSHALRAACDAVLVGIGTVLTDDPLLTVRMVPGVSPTRVVLDRRLRIPPEAKVLGEGASTVVVTSTGADAARVQDLRRSGVGVIAVGPTEGGLDLEQTLRSLRARGVRTLLVEGGARVITSFLRSGSVDRLIVSLAPTIIGAGTAAVGDLGVTRMMQAVRLPDASVHRVGPDLVVAGSLHRGTSSAETERAPDVSGVA
jgi:3,4-dihydroxy 2-butanone 4-phosphate synthase/GTP cyclohydrolase II